MNEALKAAFEKIAEPYFDLTTNDAGGYECTDTCRAFAVYQQGQEDALSLSAQQEQKPVRWLVEWTERFGEEQSLVYDSAEKAEGFVKFNDNGTITPLFAAPQASQPDSPAGFDAEFLSKRLARVAKLVGYPMPDMTHEQIAEVAGTILGSIAGMLEASQPSAEAIRREALEEAEEAVTALYEQAEPPYLVDICQAIRALAQAKGETKCQ